MNTLPIFDYPRMKTVFQNIFNFYINSSIHVAFAVCCLCGVTFLTYGLSFNLIFFGFVFFATITGYNFVKYAGIAGLHHLSLTNALKTIQVFSLMSFLMLCYCITQMPKNFILAIGFLGLLTLLYALPIFPKHKNLRTITGIKILVISLVWASVSGILPHLFYNLELSFDVYISTFQFFLYVIVITLPFDIRDLQYDQLELGTIPQRIGIKKTKVLGLSLLMLVILFEFLKDSITVSQIVSTVVITSATALFLVFSNKRQSKYYASFWVESLPILWLGMYWIILQLF